MEDFVDDEEEDDEEERVGEGVCEEEERACEGGCEEEEDEEVCEEDEELDVMLCVPGLFEERVLEETKPRLLGVTVAADTSSYVSEKYKQLKKRIDLHEITPEIFGCNTPMMLIGKSDEW